MPHSDDVTVRELPGLHRGAVHGRAVRRPDVGERRALAVPGDLQVTARDTGVGEPEVRVLATAHDVATLLQGVRPVRAVVQLQARRELTRRRGGAVATLLLRVRVALPASAVRLLLAVLVVAALLLLAAVLVVATLLVAALVVPAALLGLRVTALVVAATLGGLGVTLVVATLRGLLGVPALLVATLLVAALLIATGWGLLTVAALLIATGRGLLTVAALLVAALLLAVTLVVPGLLATLLSVAVLALLAVRVTLVVLAVAGGWLIAGSPALLGRADRGEPAPAGRASGSTDERVLNCPVCSASLRSSDTTTSP